MDTLFDFAVRGARAQAEVNKLYQQPLSHTKDPQTSDEAAEKANLNDQEYEVYIAIKNYGRKDFTAKELSKRSGLNYWTIQRRLSGLRNKDKIKRILHREYLSPDSYVQRISKRNGCCVWRLTKPI